MNTWFKYPKYQITTNYSTWYVVTTSAMIVRRPILDVFNKLGKPVYIFSQISIGVTQICQQHWATSLSKYPALPHKVTRWGEGPSLMWLPCSRQPQMTCFIIRSLHLPPPRLSPRSLLLLNNLRDAYRKLGARLHLNTHPGLMFWLGLALRADI